MIFSKENKVNVNSSIAFINNIMAEHMLLTLSPMRFLLYEFSLGIIKGVITSIIAIIGSGVIIHFFRDSIIKLLIEYVK